jgi:flagellar hook-basal body complex protein FliE
MRENSIFKKILSKSIRETNHLLALADPSTPKMVLGEKHVHQAMIALEQANLAFRLMNQMRNKMISGLRRDYVHADLILDREYGQILRAHYAIF